MMLLSIGIVMSRAALDRQAPDARKNVAPAGADEANCRYGLFDRQIGGYVATNAQLECLGDVISVVDIRKEDEGQIERQIGQKWELIREFDVSDPDGVHV